MGTHLKPDFAKRGKALKKMMAEKDLDAVMTSSQNEILYYTGYIGLKDDRLFMIFPLDGRPKLAVSPLSNEAKKFYPEIVYMEKFADVLACLKPYKAVGYDERAVSIMVYQELNKLKIRLQPATDALEALRIAKDAYEIEQIRKAAAITGKVLASVSERLVGRSEKEIADALEIGYRKMGTESAYDSIVCAGSNTQFVHHAPAAKIVGGKDAVMIDTAAKVNGYCCDVTRIFFRRMDAKRRKLYEDVKHIKDEITGIIKAGAACKDIEDFYRSLLRKKGYPVVHSFGHGVGLSVHEPTGDVLKENAVITIEPGVYIKNFAGFRVEDTVVVKKGKADVLSGMIPIT